MKINYIIIISMLITSIEIEKKIKNQYQDNITDESKLLKVGILDKNKKQNQNNYTNFSIEIIKSIAAKKQYKIQFIKYKDNQELFTGLDNKQIDIIASKIVKNKRISSKYLTSPPLYMVHEKLIYNSKYSKKPKNIEEVIYDIAIYEDENYKDMIKNQGLDSIEMKTTNLRKQEAIEDIVNNKIKYAIVDMFDLNRNKNIFKEIREAFHIHSKNVVLVFREDAKPNLIKDILSGWQQLRESSKFEQLYDKYFSNNEKYSIYEDKKIDYKIKKVLPLYKEYFKKYATYIEDFDWIKLAAISYQESLWNEKAVSYTGVRGLMMLTIPTAKQMKIKDRNDPEQSIKGGAMYLAYLLKKIPQEVEVSDKIWFALTAYNIGLGHMNDARKILKELGMNPNVWVNLKQALPLLESRNFFINTKYGFARGSEAVNYVNNIKKYYEIIKMKTEKNTSEQNIQNPA